MIDCTKLDSKFQQVLVTRLGDLHNIINSNDHLFLRLPLRGIVALFSQDRLSLTHENDVLRLLILWTTKNSVTEDFFHEVRKCVRVCQLDFTMINEVLEN